MTPIDELKIFCSNGYSISDALRILGCAPIAEINMLLDKIDYYLEHVNIINTSSSLHKNKKELETKQQFLKGIQEVLVNEVNRRKNTSVFS